MDSSRVVYLSNCDVQQKCCLKYLLAVKYIFKYIVGMIDMLGNRTNYEMLVWKIERNLLEIAFYFF